MSQLDLFADEAQLEQAIRALAGSSDAYLKFLSPNDLGLTGSHQAGIYLSRESAPLFLEGKTVEKGENVEREVRIRFRGGNVAARFVWYGKAKSECRLTRILPLFRPDPARLEGSLFILAASVPDDRSDSLFENDSLFQCWIIESEDEIRAVLDFLGITPAETNQRLRFDLNERLMPEFERLNAAVNEFPSGGEIARRSQSVYERLYGALEEGVDDMLLRLIEIEYSLFRYFERKHYQPLIEKGFQRIDDFLSLSLEIHNRRKSRAGNSLEIHLKYVFDRSRIACAHGVITSDQRRPDFLFPSLDAYESYRVRHRDAENNVSSSDAEGVFFLAAKTTCKDRWRQILTEAPGVNRRYLFTLQQAISKAQLDEMSDEGVTVVMPESYRRKFDAQNRGRILSLAEFIEKLRQSGCESHDSAGLFG